MEVRGEFVASLGFEPDPFQVRAMDALDAGRSVLVAAPTGSGKTVVAEYAVARALAGGQKAFYTTPLKALSNQKYGDLVRRHGHDKVGLLTGDNAINGEAPVVVMTTEVLRNMIYAGSSSLAALRYVVLDEVHYLQNPYRGPVWEEVIIHLAHSVSLVALSATVSNAEEVADWMATVRGATEAVIEERRPVDLHNLYMIGDRAGSRPLLLPTLVEGRPNPEAAALDSAQVAQGPRSKAPPNRRSRLVTPRRADVVERLGGEDMLPAICFIFSRKACDEAVASCLREGVRLTSPEERATIRAIAEAHVEHLSDPDLRVLRYGEWLSGLELGLAAHHAGMVPPFKEAVEHCFEQGLVKVVFATETLSLGINMPARSVVIETLSKFTGETHEDLTPSQYTQFTGRAGRRGLDPVGHALVLWSPWYGFDKVAALAASREFVLRSAFRPTYNMVVNLVRRYDHDQAHELLGRSFAQFQADRSLGKLAHRRASRQTLLAEAETAAACELGSIDEYRERRRAERAALREVRRTREDRIESAVDRLKPGDVIRFGTQRLAVLSTSYRKGSLRLRMIDPDAHVSVLDPDDFDDAPDVVATLAFPDSYDPRNRIFQRQASAQLRKASLRHRSAPTDDGADLTSENGAAASARDLAVAACPDLDRHLSAASERDRLRAQLEDVERRLHEKGSSLTRQFDRIETLLTRWGFLSGWSLTDRGLILARVFHESDLLCALVISEGLLDDLDPPSLAGLVSVLTYEHRSKEPPPTPWYPSKVVRERVHSIDRLARKLGGDELKAGLSATRLPDPSFLALAYAWAAGESFDVVIADEDLSGGDFVRNVKTLIDLLRQVGEVAPEAATRRAARAASDALFRGIVSASSEVNGSAPGAAHDVPVAPAALEELGGPVT